jgi:phosphoribosyl-AMP cyclohydrolase
MVQYREQKVLHMVFIDLEAWEKTLMNVIVMWWSLDKHEVPTKYIGLIIGHVQQCCG